MRFDAIYFIDLCKQSGLFLSRRGSVLYYEFKHDDIEDMEVFITALRLHKTELLPLFPDVRNFKQLDILYLF